MSLKGLLPSLLPGLCRNLPLLRPRPLGCLAWGGGGSDTSLPWGQAVHKMEKFNGGTPQ